ncbi:hypothetical protein V8E55_003263 [Tylopilus felleus]
MKNSPDNKIRHTLIFETATKKIAGNYICRAVTEYFQWVMFSHTWEGDEPTFQTVKSVGTIRNLDKSLLNEKLRQFCHQAWSDTCCIDKTASAILNQSLTSMYRWYKKAAATLVYLVDVLSSSKPGGLTKSKWMTCAWTLQELLALKVHTNHKESPEIKQELACTIGAAPETITNFQPENLGVRQRLCLASTRQATRKEDVA